MQICVFCFICTYKIYITYNVICIHTHICLTNCSWFRPVLPNGTRTQLSDAPHYLKGIRVNNVREPSKDKFKTIVRNEELTVRPPVMQQLL